MTTRFPGRSRRLSLPTVPPTVLLVRLNHIICPALRLSSLASITCIRTGATLFSGSLVSSR